MGKRVLMMEVPGKRTRGRPELMWLDNIRNDLSEREMSGEDTQDRLKGGISYETSTPHESGKGCGRRR